jgi:glycosyltransferase involved in cell wall biosynthesis
VLETGHLKARDDATTALVPVHQLPVSAIALPRAASLRRAAIIGNFPPRKCGIATFTRDMLACLRSASSATSWDVVALNDEGASYDYPADVTRTINQNVAGDYIATAEALNRSGAEIVFIQHEFGIYGGPAGEHLLLLMRRLRMPIITTLHTVLERPDPDQRRVMDEILRLSASVVVMARKGAEILAAVHKSDPAKVRIVPHGAPERPFAATDSFKAALGVAGRPTIMTFGLLSPNKGLETVVRALPRVLERHPDAVYMIVGATHPHLVAREGEAYRDSLAALAGSLGVLDNIRFFNRFVDDAELVRLLQATDIYATPYLTESQITSGTLSYAIALGKAIVSTPYWHAAEALADGVGCLCPFGDVDAFGRAITDLLTDDARRESLARKAWRAGVDARWSNVGRAYIDLGCDLRVKLGDRPAPAIGPHIAPPMTAVERLVDDVGMIQHGKFRVPDRAHGYCIDDTARALLLVSTLGGEGSLALRHRQLASVCAAFVNHAWNEDAGRFRNFMSWDRRWLDEGGCDDCNGRALEALCVTAAEDPGDDIREWAIDLARRAFQHAPAWTSLRASAHVVKACLAGEGAVFEPDEVQRTAAAFRDRMMAAYREQAPWFEPRLAYDNALLPGALILAARRLGDDEALQAGLSALDWLMERQTAPVGYFRPVPTSIFAESNATHAAFDQQPIEALATISACAAAWLATTDDRWKHHARQTFLWFCGDNDLGLSLVTADGGCYDGLTRTGCNRNQGAESILSYHLAASTMRRLGFGRQS